MARASALLDAIDNFDGNLQHFADILNANLPVLEGLDQVSLSSRIATCERRGGVELYSSRLIVEVILHVRSRT
jgi:hypothetical protein